MERDVAEERPGKRRRQVQEESDTEDDSGYHSSHHSSSGKEEDYAEDAMNMEERTPWTREDTITAEYIEGLQCQAISGRDTELEEDEAGKGSWTLCRNPCCYRCKLIELAELDMMQDSDKGITVDYIGNLKDTPEWMAMTVEQRIGKIGMFLAQNRQERSNLRRTGAIRLKLEEAKKAIDEKLYLGTHYMHSPRSGRDKNFRVSTARVQYLDEEMRSGFRFFMRGDIRDTAAYFENMHFMEPIVGGLYTREGMEGNFREHPIEIAGSIVESIFGLGMMYQDYRYEELSDMPAIVNFIEAGLMRQNLGRRSERLRMADYYQMGQDQWKWDEYDEIWGFGMVPVDRPTYARDLEGYRNRQAGVPDQLEESETADFYARMGRRRVTRELRRGLP